MKCPRCNGEGSIPYHIADDMFDEDVCPMCNGTGKIKQTNEEWFCSLPTEEKAEVLFDIWYDGKVLAWDKSKPFYFNRFVTWLKEVHKDEI